MPIVTILGTDRDTLFKYMKNLKIVYKEKVNKKIRIYWKRAKPVFDYELFDGKYADWKPNPIGWEVPFIFLEGVNNGK